MSLAFIQSCGKESIRLVYASAHASVTTVGPAVGEPREHMRRLQLRSVHLSQFLSRPWPYTQRTQEVFASFAKARTEDVAIRTDDIMT